MDLVQNLRTFENKKKAFLIMTLTLVILSIFFYPVASVLVLIIFLNQSYPNLKNKKLLFTALLSIAVFFNIFHIWSFITPTPKVFLPKISNILFWITEIYHASLFFLMILGVVKMIAKKYAPYSIIYVGLYNFVHALYNGCPISQLQNFFLSSSNQTLVKNIFWFGYLGDLTNVFRVLFLFIGPLLFFTSYRQYIKLAIPLEDWISFWKEEFYTREKSYNSKYQASTLN